MRQRMIIVLLVTGFGRAPESGHSGSNFRWGPGVKKKNHPMWSTFSRSATRLAVPVNHCRKRDRDRDRDRDTRWPYCPITRHRFSLRPSRDEERWHPLSLCFQSFHGFYTGLEIKGRG
ncbi:hypothetical protein BDV26DRAFT_268450 [Aspergillus bertholletiae]|uniref:Uncharacterized protein n=1 Tax=Aspergillus bertholletiae TaxID=1226010 RepID=A0A5N7AZA8_9EURO|nr:hypothetical protein BDV26DRAFT_268450 [Aspergillus bertholletiae]